MGGCFFVVVVLGFFAFYQGIFVLLLRTVDILLMSLYWKAQKYVLGAFVILFLRLSCMLNFSKIKHTPDYNGDIE